MVYTKMFLLASLLLINCLHAMEPTVVVCKGDFNAPDQILEADCIEFKEFNGKLLKVKSMRASLENVTTDFAEISSTWANIDDSHFKQLLTLKGFFHCIISDSIINNVLIKPSQQLQKQVLTLKKSQITGNIYFEGINTVLQLILDKDTKTTWQIPNGNHIKVIRE